MSAENEHQAFARRVAAALDASVTAMDARTQSRLTRLRQAALERAGTAAARSSPRGWSALWPAGAATAAVLALLLVVGQRPAPLIGPPAQMHSEDLEFLADRDALALAEDQEAPDGEADYAFYDWAAGAAQAPAAAVGT